jgi:chromate transporter
MSTETNVPKTAAPGAAPASGGTSDLLLKLWQLTISFGKVGLFAFGGGNSMIKLIEEECVVRRNWLSNDDYTALVGATFLFPGLTAEKIAGMIGLRVAGVLGLIVAALGMSLPGIILSSIFFTIMLSNSTVPLVKKLLDAMQWGAMALIGAALFDMMRPHFGPHVAWLSAILAVGLFCAMEFFGVNAIVALLAFLVIYMLLPGMGGGRPKPEQG